MAKSKFIQESKMKARQNQIELREELDRWKNPDMSGNVQPFSLANSVAKSNFGRS